ncbi:MAG: hypothetical protein M0R48_04650 [Candidatus Omnitrophica bacterium]|jgi:hypothetical protein|nr:hypothetical protein [Candidatus Omnitrophota bacterium]
MITIAASIILGLTLLMSAFLGFSPQVHKLVESDLMRRSYNNAFLYGLQLGQMGIRAKNLTLDEKTAKNIDLLFRYTNKNSQIIVQDKFEGKTTLTKQDGNLNIKVKIEHKIP